MGLSNEEIVADFEANPPTLELERRPLGEPKGFDLGLDGLDITSR